MVYIDDSSCIAIGLEDAKRNLNFFFRDNLIAAGVVPYVEKSNWYLLKPQSDWVS